MEVHLLSVKDVSRMTALTTARVRQILNEEKLLFKRAGDTEKGQIRIPNTSVKYFNTKAGIRFQKTRATIGQEKGGVGKSFMTFNTAFYLAERGANVLVIDCDPDCTMTNSLLPDDIDYDTFQTMLEVFVKDIPLEDVILKSRYDGIDFVAAKSKVRKLESKMADENIPSFFNTLLMPLDHYDCILFDVPAGMTKLAQAAYFASDKCIMPVFPDINSIEDCDLTMADLKEEEQKYKNAKMPTFQIVRNKFKKLDSKYKATNDAEKRLKEEYGSLLMDTVIPDVADVMNCINENVSVFEASSNTQLKDRVAELANEICPRIKREQNEDRILIQ